MITERKGKQLSSDKFVYIFTCGYWDSYTVEQHVYDTEEEGIQAALDYLSRLRTFDLPCSFKEFQKIYQCLIPGKNQNDIASIFEAFQKLQDNITTNLISQEAWKAINTWNEFWVPDTIGWPMSIIKESKDYLNHPIFSVQNTQLHPLLKRMELEHKFDKKKLWSY